VVEEKPLSFATSRIVTIAAFAKLCGDSRPRLSVEQSSTILCYEPSIRRTMNKDE
jgi:hypothetical protein